MNKRDIKFIKEKKKLRSIQAIEPRVKTVYQPRVQGREALAVSRGYGSPEGGSEDRSRARPVGATGEAKRRESQGVTERHDYASSPRNPNPPYSLWPQRSA